MSNQFIQRVISYVTNEIVIKGLANSKTFQRFAVQTDHHIKTGTEQLNKSFQELSQAGAQAEAGRPTPPLRGLPGFVSAFIKEVQKDLGLGGGGALKK